MGKNKRGIYWTMMGAFMALIVMICGVTLVESAKVATFHAEQTVTYNVPANIPVTLDGNGGLFGGNTTYDTVLTFDGILNGSSLVPTAPTRTGYTLSGWKYSTDGTSWSASVISPSTLFPFTDHLYLQAQWSVNKYTVTIAKNNDGYGTVTSSSVTEVPYGTTYSTNGSTLTIGSTNVIATPTTSNAQYTYAFSSWSSELGTITGNTTITANFTRTTNKYTVTIAKNNDGYGTVTSSSVTEVPYGTTYSTNGSTLTIGSTDVIATPTTSNAQYTYAFSSWSSELGTITGNTTITANFTRTLNQYNLTLTVNTGISTIYYKVNGAADYSSTSSSITVGVNYGSTWYAYATAAAGYNTPTNHDNASAVSGTMGTGGATFSPTTTPSGFTVTLLSSNGDYGSVSQGSVSSLTSGTPITVDGRSITIGNTTITATPSTNDSYGYGFTGWTGYTSTVTDNITITANFYRSNLLSDFSYSTSGMPSGEAQIYRYSGSDTTLAIPTTIGGYTVTKVNGSQGSTPLSAGADGGDNNFYYSSNSNIVQSAGPICGAGGIEPGAYCNITGNYAANTVTVGVILPDTITEIGRFTFRYFENMTSINIPNSVTMISENAFSSCGSLTSITIPASVVNIDRYAFQSCTSLTSVTFENPNGWWAYHTQLSSSDLSNTSTSATYLKTTYYNLDFKRYTPEGFFYWNGTTLVGFSQDGFNYFSSKDSVDIVIPPKATAIGTSAFTYSYWIGTGSSNHTGSSSGVTSVTFAGNNVTSIGDSAFYGCTRLTSITIPASVTSIDRWAFVDCESLSSITIEGSSLSIGSAAFVVKRLFASGAHISGGSPNVKRGVIKFAGTKDQFLSIANKEYDKKCYSDGIEREVYDAFHRSTGPYEFDSAGYFEVIATDVNFNIHVMSSVCFTSDTEVECWDEKRKRRYKKKVKDLKYSDLLIVWNFDEGKFDTAHPLWISKTMHATRYSEVTFEDGKILKVVGPDETRKHRLFNVETGKFEYIGSNMKAGTRTFTVDGVETKVKSIRTVYKDVEYYNVISNYHMNLFTSGILTSCRLNNLYDVKDMKFVKDNRKLHTREEFADIDDKWFYGLRVAEQPVELNRSLNDVDKGTLETYIRDRVIALEENAKEDKE